MQWIRVAAWLGVATVALGAFGAHGLKDRLETTGYRSEFGTAVLYQMFHVAGMLVAGLLLRAAGPSTGGWLRTAPWLFLGGIVLFSGSLYLLAITGRSGFGAVTPFGGVLFLGGWLCLALSRLPEA